MFNRILKKRIVIVSDREINAIGQCTGKMIEHIDGTLECIDPECIKFIS